MVGTDGYRKKILLTYEYHNIDDESTKREQKHEKGGESEM